MQESDDFKLKKILIKTKRKIFSEIAGNNSSIYEGEGFEFVELREYNYGEDIRRIDWNVTAKMQKPYVKVFKEERELNIVIASMMGGSVYFGQRRLKQDLIAEAAALIAFSASKNSDNFNSMIFTDRPENISKPTKKIFGVQRCVDEILRFDPLGKRVDFENFSQYIMKNIKRRSIIFILGDFFGEFDFSLISKKHEVIALIARDRLEENPHRIGLLNMIDPQTFESSNIDVQTPSIKEYKKRVQKNDHELFKNFMKNRIRFAKIYTDEDPYAKISKLFIRR